MTWIRDKRLTDAYPAVKDFFMNFENIAGLPI